MSTLKKWRTAWREWHALPVDDDNRDLCAMCRVSVTNEQGCDPSPFCNSCAQELAELVMGDEP